MAYRANLDLLVQLALRDLRARYKQSMLGALWVLFQPLSQLLIFTLVFSRHFGSADSGIPYSLFVLTGLTPWTAIVSAINSGSASLMNNAQLLRKIYFPRELLPMASVLSSLVDFAIGVSFLLVFQIFVIGRPLGIEFLLIIPTLLVQVLFLFGIGFTLAPLLVIVRDLRHVIPTVLMLWMFLTPIVYPLEKAPQIVATISAWNPAATLLGCYRSAFLGTPLPEFSSLVLTVVLALLSLGVGYGFLKWSEGYLAEIV